MKQARLKCGLTVAGKFVPKGTILEVLDLADERVQETWPVIREKTGLIAVQFSHLSFPTFVHVNEIEFL
jgi:hypothetical protein